MKSIRIGKRGAALIEYAALNFTVVLVGGVFLFNLSALPFLDGEQATQEEQRAGGRESRMSVGLHGGESFGLLEGGGTISETAEGTIFIVGSEGEPEEQE